MICNTEQLQLNTVNEKVFSAEMLLSTRNADVLVPRQSYVKPEVKVR